MRDKLQGRRDFGSLEGDGSAAFFACLYFFASDRTLYFRICSLDQEQEWK